MRVLALSHNDGLKMYSYGEGEYLGDKIPNCSPFNVYKMKNPCIKLDSGKYIWGFQCWWGEVSKLKEEFKNFELVTIELQEEVEVLPLEE